MSLKADGGTAAVNGYDVVTQPAKVRESFSLTGQFAAIDEILTGRENLRLFGTLYRLRGRARARADELLERHHHSAGAVALFQVAIALGAIAALTRVRSVWVGSLVLGGAGIALGALALAR